MDVDTTLLGTFTEALSECRISSTDDMHSSLLVYNAMCNEFLQTVRKLSCDKNKAVDASIGLQDKVFATE